eukprot:GHVU01186815.1.p1 GENE.GHVU01186815.1~~GHVU01186815.1.p1  ORF type:complete len:340 (+),score=27.98 GHVU01186815.1:486-1505(+)
MPSRDRSAADQPSRKKPGVCFLLFVVLIIACQYATYVGVVLLPLVYPDPDWPGIVMGVAFHVAFFMFLCAFIQSTTTDPGSVPSNWAFYMGDETKRRRYCKVCDVWKPDRTHHCSACGRCVLNMDHHCPWLNTCVGFHNRKFFLQLLIYSLIVLLLQTSHSVVFLCLEGIKIYDAWGSDRLDWDLLEAEHVIEALLVSAVVLMTALSLLLVFALIPFTKFHFKLVGSNSTTIENLDPGNKGGGSKYDVGPPDNWNQVCGEYRCMWMCPFHSRRSLPVGDGVRWKVDYRRLVDEEEEDAKLGAIQIRRPSQALKHLQAHPQRLPRPPRKQSIEVARRSRY